jgi:hypothetical protein
MDSTSSESLEDRDPIYVMSMNYFAHAGNSTVAYENVMGNLASSPLFHIYEVSVVMSASD